MFAARLANAVRALAGPAPGGTDCDSRNPDSAGVSLAGVAEIKCPLLDQVVWDAKPVLAFKALDSPKLAFIGGNDRATERHGVGGNEQVVAADRLAGSLEPGAEDRVHSGGR